MELLLFFGLVLILALIAIISATIFSWKETKLKYYMELKKLELKHGISKDDTQ